MSAPGNICYVMITVDRGSTSMINGRRCFVSPKQNGLTNGLSKNTSRGHDLIWLCEHLGVWSTASHLKYNGVVLIQSVLWILYSQGRVWVHHLSSDEGHCRFLPPANVVCEGYVFTPVCDSVNRGVCMVALGGVHGCSGGACMVAAGGHVWLLLGGMYGCSLGGIRGCSWGACVGYDEIWRYDQWADGTHPTGMHSCYSCGGPPSFFIICLCIQLSGGKKVTARMVIGSGCHCWSPFQQWPELKIKWWIHTLLRLNKKRSVLSYMI